MFFSVENCLNNNNTWNLGFALLNCLAWQNEGQVVQFLVIICPHVTFCNYFSPKDKVWNSAFLKSWLNYLSNDIYDSIYFFFFLIKSQCSTRLVMKIPITKVVINARVTCSLIRFYSCTTVHWFFAPCPKYC